MKCGLDLHEDDRLWGRWEKIRQSGFERLNMDHHSIKVAVTALNGSDS